MNGTMIGQTINHYTIVEKLGEGGMGIVYKARDTKLNRDVALKFLPPHLSASEQDKARFIQEAQSASALNHPNVCTIHDIAEHEGQMFIVMEFVDGRTLMDIKSSLTMKQAIDYGIQIAEGLAAAHEKGIIHRDIKPENIMVRKDGIVQIMDFGLAKLAGVSRLTKAGSTVGTAGYMSPEQVQGQETDHRSDIFSFGVLLYEMLTSKSPFTGAHESAILYEIVNVDVPPPSTVKPEIDQELDRIVLECMEKDPNERSQSIKQAAIDLNRFKRTSSRTRMSRSYSIPVMNAAKASGAVWKKYLWPGVAAVLLAAAVLLSIRQWGVSQEERQVMRFAIHLPLTTPLIGGASNIAMSPDGKNFVYLAISAGYPTLFLRPIDQLNAKPMTGTESSNDPFFSPDGQWIGFFANGKLKKISIFGGIPQDVANLTGFMRGGWWAADNTIYFGNINNAIFKVSADGGTPVPATLLDTSQNEISHRFPQILPDNETVIFTVKTSHMTTFNDALIIAENIHTHERTVLVRGGSYARYIPTGHIIFVRGSSIYAIAYDMGEMKTVGPPIPIEEGGMLNPLSGDANFGISTTGTLLYAPFGSFTGTDMKLEWLDQQGRRSSVIDSVGAYADGTISPDGAKVAMTIRAANDDIWVYQFQRKTLTRITFGGKNSDFPIWTADGKHILYASEAGTAWNLYKKPWDGSGIEEFVKTSPGRNSSLLALGANSWHSMSPDGKKIAFGIEGDIFVYTEGNNGEPERFINTPANEWNPSFSPDGKWLAYLSDESGQVEVFIVPFPGKSGKYQVSNNGAAGLIVPRWVADGSKIVYISRRKVYEIAINARSGFDYSVPKKVVDLPDTWNSFFFDVTPDGKRYIIGVEQGSGMKSPSVNIVVHWFDELTKKFETHTN